VGTPKERLGNIDFRLDQIQRGLERLYSLYEQHFTGVLKRQPEKEHSEFKTLFNSISPADLKTTASKFRFQGLSAKYIQFNNLWTKVLKQIEEGTYHRDLFLLKKKVEATEKEKPTPATPKTTPSQFALEGLYEKMKTLVKNTEKLPPKEKFIGAIQKQVDDQKRKNPDKKIEIKLLRDSAGKVHVKLGFKK
jgi:hypothetical protein